jgi:hypothetical protein
MDNIKSILEEGFRPSLSLEDLSCLGLLQKLAIPMVSFCDIPLSQTKPHMRYYGYYAIGLSKSWGQKNGVNPVLYTYQGSPLAASLSQSLVWTYMRYLRQKEPDPSVPHELLARIASILRDPQKDTPSGNQYIKLWDNLLRIQCLVKPYEGPFFRANQLFEKVRFYDEREWRFVPELGEDLIKYLLYEDDYNKKIVRQRANREIQERSRISFESNDISYIIIDSNKEILPMIKEIENIKGDRYTQNQLKVLTSKIISAEQIAHDF